MKSEDSDSDKDPLTSQVIDYYNLYSQSNQLSKYFCGVANLEKKDDVYCIPSTSTATPRPPLVGQDKVPTCETEDVHPEHPPSPSSSVASNKKLEWDNGADIGYKNAGKIKQKSVSLPILNTLERKDTSKLFLRQSPEGNTERSTPVVILVKSSSESTESSTSKEVQVYDDSTSSSSNSNRTHLTTTTSSSDLKQQFLQSLKAKVGLPVAESTPTDHRIPQYYDTTPKPRQGIQKKQKLLVATNFECNIDPTNQFQSNPSNLKSSQLSLSKLSHSCDNLSNVRIEQSIVKKWNSNMELSPCKDIGKLSVSKPVVVECLAPCPIGIDQAIQTTSVEHNSASIQTDCVKDERKQVRKDVREAQKVINMYHPADKSKYTSSSTQTVSSAELSNCNSFEYLYAKDYTDNLRESNVVPVLPSNERKSLMNPFLDINLNLPSPNSEQAQSNRTLLSSSLESIDPNILSRLSLKQSKNLYIDLEKGVELLNKLVKSKKYDNSTKKYYVKRIVQRMIDSSCSDESTPRDNKNYPTSESSEIINPPQLKENPPYPHHRSKFTLPIGPISSQPPSPIEESPLTDQYRRTFLKTDKGDDHYRIVDDLVINNTNSKPIPDSAKTNQDHLQWINKEIDQLTKLKQILQVQDESEAESKSKALRSILKEPHVDDILGIQTTTAVYTITTHKDEKGSRPMSVNEINLLRRNTKCSCECKQQDVKARVVDSQKATQTQSTSKSQTHEEPPPPSTQCKCTKTCQCSPKTYFVWENHEFVEKTEGVESTSESIPSFDSKRNASQDKERQSRIKRVTINKATSNSPIDGATSPPVSPNKTTSTKPPIRCACKCSFTSTRKPQKNTGTSTRELDTNQPSTSKQDEKLHAPIREGDGVKVPTQSRAGAQPKRFRCYEVSNESNTNCHCKLKQTDRAVVCDDMESSTSETCCYCRKQSTKHESSNSPVDGASSPPVSPNPITSTKPPTQCVCSSTSTRKQQKNVGTSNQPLSSVQHEELDDGRVPTQSRAGAQPIRFHCYEISSEISTNCHCKLKQTNQAVICDDTESSSSDTCCYCRKQKIREAEYNPPSRCRCPKEMRVKEAPLCNCCKNKRVLKNPCTCSRQQEDTTQFCSTCYPNWVFKPMENRPNYPTHTCNCYAAYQNKCLDEIKNTIKQLEDLDKKERCTCARETKKESCCYCQRRMKVKTKNKKKSYGYLLTIEPGTPNEEEPIESPVRPLNEVIVKVPDLNYYKKLQKHDGSKSTDDCKGTFHKHSCSCKKCRPATVQDYLCVNKPKFIENAEERRRKLVDLAIMREKRCQKYKQLLAMCNGLGGESNSNTNKPIIFTSKEMKSITARHYKKLPEVQEKLVNRREMNVKRGNRILTDMFNKRIRDLALKGQLDLSISTSVIKLG